MNLAGLYSGSRRYAEAESAADAAVRLYEKCEARSPALAARAKEAWKMLDGLTGPRDRVSEAYAQFTAQERDVALMLTEGATQREIARKYSLSIDEVKKSVNAIREKVVRSSDADQTIAAVAHEYKLTRRETDMLRLLRSSATIDEISSTLFLSEETVRGHVRNLLKKLSLENRADVPEWLEQYEKSSD